MHKKPFFFFTFLISVFVFFSFTFSFSQNIYSSNDINFSWQVLNSYVPTLYEGRPLPGEQSHIKLVATPIISGSSASDNAQLYYDWYINTLYASQNSGTVKNILKFDLDQLKNQNIVELKLYTDSTKGTLLLSKSITISPHDSLAIFYKQDSNPLIMYSNAINKKFESYTLNKNNILNVVAEPYYFSVNTPADQNLGYAWSQNGLTGQQTAKNVYSLSAPEYQYGDLTLNLKIENSKQFLQSAETLFNMRLSQ